ncbi:MAG: rod shape-determining protein MreC [Candidatus Pelagibacterales bacterium]|nr:MAG: rod shape-determining protein MreC [Pelagibacterales bacterium]
METSRDDFIIAVRSAFLKKGAAQRFSLLALIIISFILLSLDFFKFKPIDLFRSFTKDLIYRGSFIASLPFKSVNSSIIIIKDHFILYENYEKIKKELNLIKTEKRESKFLKTQNKELKNAIKDTLKQEKESIVAKVLLDKKSPFLKSVVINKGTKTNLKKGMAVLHRGNMIGRIVEVNYLSSRVLLLSDLNSKIPVKIEPSGDNAIVSGAGNNIGTLLFLPKKSMIEVENLVFTSGTDGIFNEGIPVGKIIKLEDNFFVEFFEDLNQLNYVNIIKYEEEKN